MTTEDINPTYPTTLPVEPVAVVEEVSAPAVVEPVAVVEEKVVATPAPEIVAEPIAKSKNDEPAAVAVKPRGSKAKVVHTSALVFKSNARNSISVGLVQERLVELGHADAGSDKYGWLGEGTMKSLAEFAKTSVEKCNPQDATMISKLFAGTSTEVVA